MGSVCCVQIKGKYNWAKHIDFMLIDLLSLLMAFFAAYFLKFHTLAMDISWKRLLAIMVLLNIIITFGTVPYSGIFRRRYYRELRRQAALVVTNALLATFMFYLLQIGSTYSRDVVFFTYAFYFFFAVVLKYIWKLLLVSQTIKLTTTKKMSMFLICDEETAEEAIRNAEAGDLSIYEIKGVHFGKSSAVTNKKLPTNHKETKFVTGAEGEQIPVIGKDFIQFVLDNNIDEVLVASLPESLRREEYKKLVDNGVSVDIVIESALGFQTEKQQVSNIGVYKALSVGAFSFSPSQLFYLVIKRLIDIFSGLLGLVILIPVTIGVKITNLLSGDTAKVFYQQKRVGKDGKIIKIWKFRSMVPNADEILKELLKNEAYRKEWEENQKFEHDPRITKAGQVLRKTSIDELPQLINVLTGDMSLVGPRPLVEGELEQHGGLKIYNKVKPGITGWWACNGRSNIDYRERLELEYFYVRNCSLYLDVLCIIRTFVAVVRKEGAK